MKRLTYTRPHLLSSLHQQLVDAGLPPLRCEGGYPGKPDDLALEYDDATDAAAVAAVVAAHDKAAAEAAQTAAAQQVTTDKNRIDTAEAELEAERDLLVAGAPTAADVRRILLLLVRVQLAMVRWVKRRQGA